MTYVLGPCTKTPGHPGRCRNRAGTSWEGHCDAQPAPTTDPGADT